MRHMSIHQIELYASPGNLRVGRLDQTSEDRVRYGWEVEVELSRFI